MTVQRATIWLIVPILGVMSVALVGAYADWAALTDPRRRDTPLVFEIVLAVFLSLLAPLICIVQTRTKRRQLDRLEGLGQFPVGRTMYYRTAVRTISDIQEASLGSDYSVPMFVYFVTIALGSFAFLVGFNYPFFFDVPNLILSGSYDDSEVILYQRQTFVAMGVAFFASYAYSLGMLLNRVNNNDLYPISLYYYTARVVITCLMAAVVRHCFGLMDSTVGGASLLVVVFTIGFAPDLVVLSMIRRGFQILKVWGTRADPDPKHRPAGMPLLMIDDLSRDKIDRLNELGVDSAQCLARQNPFLLLPRMPYELALIVDWMAQAELYVFAREDGLEALRKIHVRDIFDLRLRLGDATQGPEVARVLGLGQDCAAALQAQIDANPIYARLAELRAAMSELRGPDMPPR